MGCCRKVLHHYSTSKRGVFCLRWVLPLQILVISSLGIHLLYKFLYKPSAYSFIITLVHVFFALLILAECRRSIRYHNAIKELEALGDRRRDIHKNAKKH